MNKNNQQIKSDKLEFNTYYIFAKEKQEINNIIELIFKDYIENTKNIITDKNLN